MSGRKLCLEKVQKEQACKVPSLGRHCQRRLVSRLNHQRESTKRLSPLRVFDNKESSKKMVSGL